MIHRTHGTQQGEKRQNEKDNREVPQGRPLGVVTAPSMIIDEWLSYINYIRHVGSVISTYMQLAKNVNNG